MPIGAFCAFLGSVRLVRYFTDFLGHAEYAARFGRLLDAKESGQNLENGFKALVLHTYQSNQCMEDWDIDLLADLDMPLWDETEGCYRRLRKEWCGLEWNDEERKHFTTDDDYREYEEERQKYYCDIFKDEFPIV